MNKITIISNRNYSVKKFRLGLIEALKEAGFNVSLIIVDDTDEERLTIDNVDIHYISDDNRSTNPLKKLKLQKQIETKLKEINPDKVFTFQAAPNTFGVLAAKNCKIKEIYSMLEGAGDVFTYNTVKWKLVRTVMCFLYKKSFKNCKKVFFLNNDDKDEFIKRRIVKESRCIVIPGVGVDTEKFEYKPITNTNTFLMMARMMPSKGVMEYCKAARLVKEKHPEAIFNFLGEEFTLKKSDIQEYIDDGSINYLGWQEDVRPYLENCFMYIHPSYYREGFPMAIMEASSTGRPTICFDNIGCRDAVKDGINGYIIKERSVQALVDKIIYVLENKDEMLKLSFHAREYIIENNSKEVINKKIIKYIR